MMEMWSKPYCTYFPYASVYQITAITSYIDKDTIVYVTLLNSTSYLDKILSHLHIIKEINHSDLKCLYRLQRNAVISRHNILRKQSLIAKNVYVQKNQYS